MNITDEWVIKAQQTAEIAQKKYKDTPIEKPWPKWEKSREEAMQIWIASQTK